jgi:hypothetical protein
MSNPIDLVSSSDAQLHINQASFSTNETTLIGELITSVSRAIGRYCRRPFVAQDYDELYSGHGERRLTLRQYPLVSVKSVRYRPVTALRIQNTDTATNQQVRVAVTSTGITLTRIASGVLTTDTSTVFATFPTLQGCANNINSLGASWTAQVDGSATGDYGLWPSADLYCPNGPTTTFGGGAGQGNLTARGQNAELKLHTYELAGYQIEQRQGHLLRAIPYTDPELLHPEDLIWPVGINNFRIQYNAGFSTIPEDVQLACMQWVAALFWESKDNPAVVPTTPPAQVLILLSQYKRHTFVSMN